MARKHRIHYPGALYHVILRGNAQQSVFYSDKDRYHFYLFVQEGVERFGHRVLAFCFMTNHIHMAIQVADVPLSRIMQNLTFRYTQWLNWRLNRTGHLFQGRYKAVLVDADAYLLELTAYVHLNPVRAGMVDNPEDYPWSSQRAYSGTELIPWLNTEYILTRFSSVLSDARDLLNKFVTERSKDGHRNEFYGKESADSRVMGEDAFVENVLAQTETLLVCKPSLEAVLVAVLKIYNLQEEDLSSLGQKRLPSAARSLAAWGVLELTDATLTELAVRLKRDVSTLSAAIRRFEGLRRNRPECAEKVERLKKELQVATLQA